jgi:hypothetical protein
MAKFMFLIRMFIDKPKEKEDEFNRWYWDEHIPTLSKVPGILSARRYVHVASYCPDSPKYIAFYELEHSGVMESKEWNSWAYSSEWARRTAPQEGNPGVYEEILPKADEGLISASCLYVNRFYPKPEKDEFFREWVEKTLLPEAREVQGVLKCRFYQATGNVHRNTPPYLLIFELRDSKVVNEQGWKRLSSPDGILKPVRNVVLHKNFPGVYERLLPPPDAGLTLRW